MSDQSDHGPDASLGADEPGPGSGGKVEPLEATSSGLTGPVREESADVDPALPPRKRLGKALGKAVGRSPRMEALAQRAQQTAKQRLATARQAQAVNRALEAGRVAREAALPRLSHARDGVQQRIVDHPEVAEQVARSLAIAVMHMAAAAKSGDASVTIKKTAPLVGDHVGKTVSRLLAKSPPQRERAAADEDDGPELREGLEQGGDAAQAAAAQAARASVSESGAMDLGKLAESLGVQPPPDPAALYQDGPGTFELLFPLPEELASLPWGSLSRRNRFYLLVAAWARREADGIQLLKAGQIDQASEAFQECLIRAEHVQTPELVARSYSDLAELATASGDEDAAGAWRAAAQAEGG